LLRAPYVGELDVAVETRALASILLGRPSLDRPCFDCSATCRVWWATGILGVSVLLSAMTCPPVRRRLSRSSWKFGDDGPAMNCYTVTVVVSSSVGVEVTL
jgi:hypothetical protein